MLNVKLRLTDAEGNPIKEEAVLALINLPLHTIFRQLDVTFQQKPFSHIGTNYAYKSYIDTILKTNHATQSNILSSQLFYEDNGFAPDSADGKTGGNGGPFREILGYKRWNNCGS